MIIEIKKYKKHRLHNDLSLNEELVLLIFKELYMDKPFSSGIAIESLGFTAGYISKMARGLIQRGYIKKIGKLLDICNPTSDFIDTEFIFTNDLTIDDKRMIILLYKTFVNRDNIDTKGLNSTLPEDLTTDLIDKLIEEGVIMHSIPLDFNDVFSLNSHYDA
jgi:hypothetical protein